MNQPAMGQSCQTKCWAAAAVIGILIMILALASGNHGWGTSIFLGVLAAVLLGFLMTWLMCSDVPKLGQSERAKSASSGAGTAGAGTGAPAASGTTRSAEPAAPAARSQPEAAQPAPAKTAEAVPAKAEEPKAEAAAAPAEPAVAKDGDEGSGDSAVKPSKPLAGQAELSSRKGSYKYEGGTEKPPAKKAAKTKKAATKKAATARAEPEAETEGTRPEVLDAPRDGGADDLKKIKGIGPKLEELCNSMGFYHFDQIANWTPEEVAWVDANLEGFRGRVTRDDWVKQAQLLASGGETEFSKRVDKGGVY